MWHQEEDMGPRTTRFAVFWMALAMAVTILAIKPWAGAPDAQSKSAASIAARENHLPAATLEFVLKLRQAIRGMNAGGRMRRLVHSKPAVISGMEAAS